MRWGGEGPVDRLPGPALTQGLCDRCWEEPATRIARDAQGRRLEIGERCKRLNSEGLAFDDPAPASDA